MSRCEEPRILLLGADGQLGWELRRRLAGVGAVHASSRGGEEGASVALALDDTRSVRELLRSLEPELVVNAAAYTAVDDAERHPHLAKAVNETAPALLAEESRRLGAFLLHYSTDYVFDGEQRNAYREDDTPNPLNVYGRTKLAGEEAIRASGAAHLILRTSALYSSRRKNFLLAIRSRAERGSALGVVDDQVTAPTWVRPLAALSARLLGEGPERLREHQGTYHLSASGSCSWHEFALAILRGAGLAESLLRPIPTAQYPTPAARPRYSVLDCAKLERDFGCRMAHWRAQLRAFFAAERAERAPR